MHVLTGLICLVQAGAFLPRDPQYAQMLTTVPVSIPTLFVSGTNDQLIPPERTHQLAETFDQNCVQKYVHSGGHMMPTCTGEFKRCLQEFLDKHGVAKLPGGQACDTQT